MIWAFETRHEVHGDWFAFYDTITDTFVSFDDTQIWEEVDEFRRDFNAETNGKFRDIDRFIGLIPPSFKGEVK